MPQPREARCDDAHEIIASAAPWPRKLDALIAALARAQQGVVARAQLLRVGVPGHLVDHRVARGLLEPVHHGVYRVGPLAGADAREMAAVLACGGVARLARLSAAGMWEVHRRNASGDDVDVLVTGFDRGRRPGIRRHRVRTLPGDEATQLRGVPITTPARTLLDVAPLLRARDFERAVAAAERAALARPDDLLPLLERYPRHRGAGIVRTLLAAGAAPSLTRSEAEELLLALIRRAKLPRPETNVWVAGHEVDFYWRAERVVVEVDGYAHHSSRSAFERDRDRDGDLVANGILVLRVTWRQLVDEPEVVLVRLTTALNRR